MVSGFSLPLLWVWLAMTNKNSWTSTFGGVNCLNKGSFSHCVYSDSKNRVWFGTEDGAICYDPKKGYAHPKIYNTELGLSDNSVASIIEDYKGRIWIGTTCGLNQVDTEKEQSTSTSRTMAYRAMSSAMQLPARSGEKDAGDGRSQAVSTGLIRTR